MTICSRPLLRVVLTIGLTAHATLLASAPPQKPVRETTSHMLFIDPPGKLTAMVDAADAIVSGVLISSRGRVHDGPAGKRLVTDHVFRLTAVHKQPAGPLAAGAELMVIGFGGDVDAGDHVRRDRIAEWEPLAKGGQFLLFLKWNSAFDGYIFQYGPGGIISERDGQSVAHRKVGATRDLDSLGWTAMIHKLNATAAALSRGGR